MCCHAFSGVKTSPLEVGPRFPCRAVHVPSGCMKATPGTYIMGLQFKPIPAGLLSQRLLSRQFVHTGSLSAAMMRQAHAQELSL